MISSPHPSIRKKKSDGPENLSATIIRMAMNTSKGFNVTTV